MRVSLPVLLHESMRAHVSAAVLTQYCVVFVLFTGAAFGNAEAFVEWKWQVSWPRARPPS